MNFVICFATTVPSQHTGQILHGESFIIPYIIRQIDTTSLLTGVPVLSPVHPLDTGNFHQLPSISPLMTK